MLVSAAIVSVVVSADMVSADIVWPDMVSADMVSADIVWPDMVSADIVWPDMVSVDIVWPDMVWPDIVAVSVPVSAFASLALGRDERDACVKRARTSPWPAVAVTVRLT